jgi:hypothetical protein
MSLSKYSNNKICIVEDDHEASIECDGIDIYLNYDSRRLMVEDHELFDLIKKFLEEH